MRSPAASAAKPPGESIVPALIARAPISAT